MIECASLNEAKVAGVYFPAELSAEEIALSIEHGVACATRTSDNPQDSGIGI